MHSTDIKDTIYWSVWNLKMRLDHDLAESLDTPSLICFILSFLTLRWCDILLYIHTHNSLWSFFRGLLRQFSSHFQKCGPVPLKAPRVLRRGGGGLGGAEGQNALTFIGWMFYWFIPELKVFSVSFQLTLIHWGAFRTEWGVGGAVMDWNTLRWWVTGDMTQTNFCFPCDFMSQRH